jgi:hypothetical protein
VHPDRTVWRPPNSSWRMGPGGTVLFALFSRLLKFHIAGLEDGLVTAKQIRRPRSRRAPSATGKAWSDACCAPYISLIGTCSDRCSRRTFAFSAGLYRLHFLLLMQLFLRGGKVAYLRSLKRGKAEQKHCCVAWLTGPLKRLARNVVCRQIIMSHHFFDPGISFSVAL